MGAVLRGQHVFGQRFQLAVLLELATPVVGLGGVRQHLDDEGRIQQGVELGVVELGLAANHHHVRAAAQPAPINLDLQVIGISFAKKFFELKAQFAYCVSHNEVMRLIGRGRGEDFTIEKFALEVGAAFEGQIILGFRWGLRSRDKRWPSQVMACKAWCHKPHLQGSVTPVVISVAIGRHTSPLTAIVLWSRAGINTALYLTGTGANS